MMFTKYFECYTIILRGGGVFVDTLYFFSLINARNDIIYYRCILPLDAAYWPSYGVNSRTGQLVQL